MDPFDDILPAAPAARGRAGGRFAPKAKLKPLPRKEVTAPEHETSSKDGKDERVASSSTSKGMEGISQNGCRDAVASISTMPAEQSIGSKSSPQVELPNLEDATKSEMGNPQQVSVNADPAALVDSAPSTIASSEAESDWNLTNLPKSASEADPVASEVGPDTNFIPETHLVNGSTQPVQPADAVENLLSNVAAPSTTCSTRGSIEEPPKIGEGSFLDGNKGMELIDNSLQIGPDVGFESASDNSNMQSNFNFGREREAESGKFGLDPFSDVLPDPGSRTARKFQPKIKPRPRVGTAPAVTSASSNVMMERSVELPISCTNEVQSFQSSGYGSGRLNQSTNSPIPTSEIPTTTDLSNKFDCMSSSIPFSEDNNNLAAVIPSQLDSHNAMLSDVAVHNRTRDWPSSFGKSAGENADVFYGLESLDDFLTKAAADTGKPALQSFNEKSTEGNFVIPAFSSMNTFGVCDTQVQRFPEYHTTQDSLTFDEAAVLNEDDTCANNRRSETEEVVDLSPSCPVDNVLDYQSVKSGTDPTSEIPVHEELTNAANSPTVGDFLQADVTGVKEDANGRKKDGTMLSSLRKRRRSSTAGEEDKGVKTSRQLRKQAARKPVNNSVNEDDDDLDPPYNNPNRDELEENDDEFEVDDSSKKKTSLSSTKKSVAKNGKTSQKRKKANEDLENTSKELPKKFSHSTRRRKRCVDKALLEIPEDELDPRTLPLKDIILLAEYRERLAKKEATTSKTSSTNQSGGDSLHGAEASANGEEEILGSEDDREPGDDQASESVPLAASLFNYQSFMDKAPRGKWSKQDTELFYEAVRQFGTDFSMIQQLFPDRTRHQIKLKYKKEERQHPLRLADAVNNRAKDHTHFKMVIERLQQASTKADQHPGRDASDFMAAEEVEDLAPGTNEEVAATEREQEEVAVTEQEQEAVATTEQVANVKDQEVHSPEQSDDSDDDFQRWAEYKSEY